MDAPGAFNMARRAQELKEIRQYAGIRTNKTHENEKNMEKKKRRKHKKSSMNLGRKQAPTLKEFHFPCEISYSNHNHTIQGQKPRMARAEQFFI